MGLGKNLPNFKRNGVGKCTEVNTEYPVLVWLPYVWILIEYISSIDYFEMIFISNALSPQTSFSRVRSKQTRLAVGG